MSNALPLSNVPAAPASRPRPTFLLTAVAPANRRLASVPPPTSGTRTIAVEAAGKQAAPPAPKAAAPALAQVMTLAPGVRLTPLPPPVPRTMPERMIVARDRIRAAAESGRRIRAYEVALDLDLSEFHFARQFRAAFGRSPHRYYDEVRADLARALLREGLIESEVARRVGFRRPAELRSLLVKRPVAASV